MIIEKDPTKKKDANDLMTLMYIEYVYMYIEPKITRTILCFSVF